MLLGRLQHYKPVTNKKIKGIGSGKATKGNRATHGDIVEQTLTEPNMLVSCTLCSFKITCWTMELARKVVRKHQRRRNPMHPDKDMEQGTYNAPGETDEKTLAEEEPVDDDEQKSVQEIDSNGENIEKRMTKKTFHCSS